MASRVLRVAAPAVHARPPCRSEHQAYRGRPDAKGPKKYGADQGHLAEHYWLEEAYDASSSSYNKKKKSARRKKKRGPGGRQEVSRPRREPRGRVTLPSLTSDHDLDLRALLSDHIGQGMVSDQPNETGMAELISTCWTANHQSLWKKRRAQLDEAPEASFDEGILVWGNALILTVTTSSRRNRIEKDRVLWTCGSKSSFDTALVQRLVAAASVGGAPSGVVDGAVEEAREWFEGYTFQENTVAAEGEVGLGNSEGSDSFDDEDAEAGVDAGVDGRGMGGEGEGEGDDSWEEEEDEDDDAEDGFLDGGGVRWGVQGAAADASPSGAREWRDGSSAAGVEEGGGKGGEEGGEEEEGGSIRAAVPTPDGAWFGCELDPLPEGAEGETPPPVVLLFCRTQKRTPYVFCGRLHRLEVPDADRPGKQALVFTLQDYRALRRSAEFLFTVQSTQQYPWTNSVL